MIHISRVEKGGVRGGNTTIDKANLILNIILLVILLYMLYLSMKSEWK